MGMHYNDLINEHLDSTLGSEDAEGREDLKPLHSIELKKEEELKKWFKDTLGYLEKEAAPRRRNQLNNCNFYNGIHTLSNNSSTRAEDYDNQPVSESNRFVMNHILEFTLHKQARLLRYSPNINVFPWSNEYAARLGAKLGKKIIDSCFYINGLDDINADVTLEAAICGESFLFTEWDKYAGNRSKLVEDATKKLKLGATFTTDSGTVIKLADIERVGDVTYKLPHPWQVLHEPKSRWKNVNYVFYAEVMHIDDVLAEYALNKRERNTLMEQGKALQEKPDPSIEDYNKTGSYVLRWTFYHERTKYVPNGFYARFCGEVLMEQGDLPYSRMPCSRFTDYDDPRNAHGRSFYESLKLPSVMINNMMKVAYRSYVIAAYPKIIMQQDSCNMYAMANGPFVMEYTPGAKPPEIVSFNAVNQDFFPLTQHVERFMEKNSGTFGISRGDTVPNARAGSILNFYEEQEQERESTQIRKINAFIEKTAQNTFKTFTSNASVEDERTIQVVGKNNMYKARKLTSEDFKRLANDMVVKVVRTTALSESRQGRIDQITALSNVPLSGEDAAGLFTREQILQMVEIADTPTFFEMATAAAERALSEIEDLYEGLEIDPVMEHQAFLVDWNCYFQFMQSAEFCSTKGIPVEIKNKFLDRMRAMEMFMYEKAKYNLALASILAKNKYFPSVYRLDITDLPLSHIVLMLSNPPPVPMPMQSGPGEQVPTGDSMSPNAEGVAEEDAIPEGDMQEEQQAPEEMPDALPGDEAVM